jgi:hypothetical protein
MAKLVPTDRNNATEKLLSVALFLSVGKTRSVCKEFCVLEPQPCLESKILQFSMQIILPSNYSAFILLC